MPTDSERSRLRARERPQYLRMPQPSPLHPELGPHFRVGTALELGATAGRMRRGDLERPFHGIRSRTRGTPPDLVAAYLTRLPDDGFFSHLTAARLWGLPLPPLTDPRLHVSYPHGHRPARGRGVVGHHLVIRDAELTVLRGVQVTTPERTWCDLAGVLGFEALIAAGDRALWHRDPLTSFAAIADLARRHPDRRHRRKRLAALPWLHDRSDSPPETNLRVRFVLAGLPTPAVNEDVFDDAGVFLGRPDLSFPAYRELVDYEGDGHRSTRGQWWSDLARVPRFERAGWHSHRAATPDLDDGSRRLILDVARSLHAKGWRGRLTL